MEREQDTKRARELAVDLVARGVRAVALTFVDNAGITRVKAVPVTRLERAAGWGVGMSPVFDVFCVDDSTTTSRHIGGPAGDLRLYPDLEPTGAAACPARMGVGPGRSADSGRRSLPGLPAHLCRPHGRART